MAWYSSAHCDLSCTMHFTGEKVQIFCRPETHILFVHYSVQFEMCLIWKSHIYSMGLHMCIKFVHHIHFENLTRGFAGYNISLIMLQLSLLIRWFSLALLRASNSINALGGKHTCSRRILLLQKWSIQLKLTYQYIAFLRRAYCILKWAWNHLCVEIRLPVSTKNEFSFSALQSISCCLLF